MLMMSSAMSLGMHLALTAQNATDAASRSIFSCVSTWVWWIMSGEYAVLVCGLVVVFRTLLRTTQAARTLERLRKAYVICCIMACLFRTVHLFSQPLIYGCNWPEQNFAWYIPGSSLIFTFVLGWFLLVLHVFASRGTPRCQLAGTAALAVLGCVWLSPLLFLPLKTVYSLGGSMAILTAFGFAGLGVAVLRSGRLAADQEPSSLSLDASLLDGRAPSSSRLERIVIGCFIIAFCLTIRGAVLIVLASSTATFPLSELTAYYLLCEIFPIILFVWMLDIVGEQRISPAGRELSFVIPGFKSSNLTLFLVVGLCLAAVSAVTHGAVCLAGAAGCTISLLPSVLELSFGAIAGCFGLWIHLTAFDSIQGGNPLAPRANLGLARLAVFAAFWAVSLLTLLYLSGGLVAHLGLQAGTGLSNAEVYYLSVLSPVTLAITITFRSSVVRVFRCCGSGAASAARASDNGDKGGGGGVSTHKRGSLVMLCGMALMLSSPLLPCAHRLSTTGRCRPQDGTAVVDEFILVYNVLLTVYNCLCLHFVFVGWLERFMDLYARAKRLRTLRFESAAAVAEWDAAMWALRHKIQRETAQQRPFFASTLALALAVNLALFALTLAISARGASVEAGMQLAASVAGFDLMLLVALWSVARVQRTLAKTVRLARLAVLGVRAKPEPELPGGAAPSPSERGDAAAVVVAEQEQKEVAKPEPELSLRERSPDSMLPAGLLVQFWTTQPLGVEVLTVELSWPLFTRYCLLLLVQAAVFLLRQLATGGQP